jgi:hypothetical protein
MSIFSDLTRAWTWFTKVFVSHAVSADKVAVTITETLKTLLANPVTGFLLNMADAVTGTQVPTNIANAINGIIPKILAVELGIEGLPANPTADQITAFENQVLSAFNVSSNNSKLYTEVGAQVYGIIQANITNGTTNFAGWVVAIETAYTDYKKDLAANAAAVTPEPATSFIRSAVEQAQSVGNTLTQPGDNNPPLEGTESTTQETPTS